MRALSICSAAATLLLAACPRGGAAPTTASHTGGGTTADDALRSLGDACRAGDSREVLTHLASQGLAGDPKFGRAMRADDPMADGIIEDVCEPFPAELVVLATIGTQDAGREWMTVTVQLPDGASVAYRLVELDGAWLLAEVE